MSLVCENGSWRIDGAGSERARVAYAHLENDRVIYTIEGQPHAGYANPFLAVESQDD